MMDRDHTRKFAFECPDCSLVLALYENARFCSWCGASISAYEGEDLQGKKHVLIADDAALTSKKIGAICKSLGCVVTAAKAGADTLDKVRGMGPGLLVLDMHMPQMSGLNVLQNLYSGEDGRSPITVMLTVVADPSTVEQCIKAGATDYILKDLSVAEIRERLRKYV